MVLYVSKQDFIVDRIIRDFQVYTYNSLTFTLSKCYSKSVS